MAGSYQTIDSLFRRGSQQMPKASIGIVVEGASKTGTPENEPLFSLKKPPHISLGKVSDKDAEADTKAEKETVSKAKLSPWVSTRSERHGTPITGPTSVEKFPEKRSETLKLKLLEALGDASQSQHVHLPSKEQLNEKTENNEDPPMRDLRRPLRETDTIETDSGNRIIQSQSTNRTRRRALTRSTEQKIEPRLTRSQRRKSQLPSDEKPETKNVFTFDDCEKRKPAENKLSFVSRSTSTKSLRRSKSLQSTDKKQPPPQPPQPQEEIKNPSPERFSHMSESNSSQEHGFDIPNPDVSDGTRSFSPAVSPTLAVRGTPPFQKEEPSPVQSPLTTEASSSRSEQMGGSSSSGSPLVYTRSKKIPEPSSDLPFYTSRSVDTAGSPCTLEPSLEDDNLGRAIAQLAVVMDKFKAKIRSYTSKKGSEILAAAKDSFLLQLQEVELHIQADTEKLAGHCKSKRKRLESAILEEQEKLKQVYDRFKEDVDRHLVNCRSSLEDLEAYEEEVRGNVDRQRSMHRKLVLQVEETMEARLAEAEASVAAVQKAARRKMNSLKGALKEWLTDDCALR